MKRTPTEPPVKLTEILQKWAGKTRFTVVFDSDADGAGFETFQTRLLHRSNLAFVGITQNNDVFGAYLNVTIDRISFCSFYDDPDHFIFSFNTNGRCRTPRRWFVKESRRHETNGLIFSGNPAGYVKIGCPAGYIYMGPTRADAYSWNVKLCYDRIDDDTLTGVANVDWSRPFTHYTRMLVLEWE